MSKPRRPEDGEDVRRRLLLFLAATDGLSPREIADALERTAAGEYGTAVEAICSGLHENNSRISGDIGRAGCKRQNNSYAQY